MWLQLLLCALLLTFFICSNNHFAIIKMAVLSKIKFHSDAVDYFKELPFYKPIEKTQVKRLKNIDQLRKLPFYEQLRLIKTDQAFRGYAM